MSAVEVFGIRMDFFFFFVVVLMLLFVIFCMTTGHLHAE